PRKRSSREAPKISEQLCVSIVGRRYHDRCLIGAIISCRRTIYTAMRQPIGASSCQARTQIGLLVN
ncbi:hypothetical protein, partial [Mesorhizobium sp. M7A.F.Ca.CA.001.12.2.1]|uniref:hypothetical protein n=1 Tax=Mesorhizobium sp. M7A.F.Ca.CA.001.12.2.1 TaxID=2496725 RepID=UPI0019D15C81